MFESRRPDRHNHANDREQPAMFRKRTPKPPVHAEPSPPPVVMIPGDTAIEVIRASIKSLVLPAATVNFELRTAEVVHQALLDKGYTITKPYTTGTVQEGMRRKLHQQRTVINQLTKQIAASKNQNLAQAFIWAEANASRLADAAARRESAYVKGWQAGYTKGVIMRRLHPEEDLLP